VRGAILSPPYLSKKGPNSGPFLHLQKEVSRDQHGTNPGGSPVLVAWFFLKIIKPDANNVLR